MGKTERWILWGLLLLQMVALIVSVAILYGDLATLREQVERLVGARPAVVSTSVLPSLPEPLTNGSDATTWGNHLSVRVDEVTTPLSTTLALTLTVQGTGAVDPLLDLPVLVCGEIPYPVEQASLAAARQALLSLVSQGEVQVQLRFSGTPDLELACYLILNAEQPVDSLVAPRLDVRVPQISREKD